MADKSEEILRRYRAMYAKRLTKAAIFLQGQIRQLISVPSRSVSFQKTKGGKIKKVLGPRGNMRSQPGQPPHMDHGALRASITYEVDRENLTARIGSPSKVARWMELGTPGGKIITPKTKKVLANVATGQIFGKRVRQGAIRPRPFLRRSLKENMPAIRRIIEHGGDDSINVGS